MCRARASAQAARRLAIAIGYNSIMHMAERSSVCATDVYVALDVVKVKSQSQRL